MTMTQTRDAYLGEVGEFGALLLTKFPHSKPHWVSYSGGVPGMQATLTADQYEEAKRWLTELFGEPEVKEPWHPQHTKGIAPLCYHQTPTMEHMRMSHVNLIAMMQRKDKRYTKISWM